MEQYSESDEVQKTSTGIEGLLIPDGFNFNMSEKKQIDITFQSSNGRIAENEALQFALFGVDLAGEIHGLQIGHTTLSTGIFMNITKPMHIEQLYLNTKYLGNSRFFELTSETLVISASELIIDDEVF